MTDKTANESHAVRFPGGFRLGVASAATQIEGGNARTNWHAWAEQGHIKQNATPARANMHWEKWKEDDTLMAELGISAARIGIEWARIEPERGVFDPQAIRHYREELAFMRSHGIEPLVTLHHFSNPTWFDELGGWEKYENLPLFMEFATYAVTELGDLCDRYITVNEPNVYAMNGYLGIGFPPGKNSMALYREVLSNLAAAHVACYRMIHRIIPGAKVSAAIHMRAFAPKNPQNPWHRLCARIAEFAFQTAVTKAMACGTAPFPVIKRRRELVRGEWCDFWGLNYYSRSTISGLSDGVREHAPVNDLGWEIYPAGITETARKLYRILPRDIAVTENGTCDNADAWRSRYIAEHLKEILESGLPVTRYYHWCFLDNFEWLEGETARFGLVHVDYQTQQRTVKDSGRFFSRMIAAGGIDEPLYAEYCANQSYITGP